MLNAGHIDIHCHCLPDIDDGPASLRQSLELCQKLVNDGVSTVVATSHQLGRFENITVSKIRSSVKLLREQLVENDIPLEVLPGAEIRVDERIVDYLRSDQLMTVADRGNWVMLEMPSDVFIDIESLLVRLCDLKIKAILVHPERNLQVLKRLDVLKRWLEIPVYIQITAGSFLNAYGQECEKAAWALIEKGFVHIVASDAHSPEGYDFHMSRAYNLLKSRLGLDVAEKLFCQNPKRVVWEKETLVEEGCGCACS